MPVSLPYTLSDGTTAYGSEVKADLDALANKFSSGPDGIKNADISDDAFIAGYKISPTSPIQGGGVPGTTRIAKDAITVYELRQDENVSGNRAVHRNHIQDAAVSANRIDMASPTYSFTIPAQGGGIFVQALTITTYNTGTNYEFRIAALRVQASAPVQYTTIISYPGPAATDRTDTGYAVANYTLIGAYISGLNDSFGTANQSTTGFVVMTFIKKA